MYKLSTKYSDIEKFLESVKIDNYSRNRNFLDGDVTHLSAYITHGVLDQVMVLESLKERFSDSVIKPFLFQMAWREYFHNIWFELGDDIFSDIKSVQKDVEHYGLNLSMVNARTGLLAIDEQVRQLLETGYMHNHARMWLASYVCNFGKFYWLENSKWLYYHLLDGDLAANMLSWQWVAGTFSSKKYLFNQNNLNKYSKISQSGTFLDCEYENLFDQAFPEYIKQEQEFDLQTEYPASVDLDSIDLSSNVLLYHPWMLDPLWMSNSSDSRILLIEPRVFDRFPVSPMRMKFICELAKNISGLQVCVMNFSDLRAKYPNVKFTSQIHPLVVDWDADLLPKRKLFPALSGYDSSFFKFWKKAEKLIKIH